MDQLVCRVDGQTLEWHMRYSEVNALGEPRYFGDILGCGFITPLDRLAAEDRRKRAKADRVPDSI